MVFAVGIPYIPYCTAHSVHAYYYCSVPYSTLLLRKESVVHVHTRKTTSACQSSSCLDGRCNGPGIPSVYSKFRSFVNGNETTTDKLVVGIWYQYHSTIVLVNYSYLLHLHTIDTLNLYIC